MLRSILEARAAVALVVAAGVGTWGLHAYPVRPDEVFLALIQVRKPSVFLVLVYGYEALWFTTPYYLASMLTSLVTIVVYRRVPAMRSRPMPPYPVQRSGLRQCSCWGNRTSTPRQDARRNRGGSASRSGISIRGVVMVLGAVGTGKTSACSIRTSTSSCNGEAAINSRRLAALY
jgi:hypothetical protein